MARIEKLERKKWWTADIYKIVSDNNDRYTLVVGDEAFSVFEDNRQILGTWRTSNILELLKEYEND